jgi:hypothetical protein
VAPLAGEATDAQIAERLFVSVNTVRSHLDRIRDHAGERRRPELVPYAVKAGVQAIAPSTRGRPRLSRGHERPRRAVRQGIVDGREVICFPES